MTRLPITWIWLAVLLAVLLAACDSTEPCTTLECEFPAPVSLTKTVAGGTTWELSFFTDGRFTAGRKNTSRPITGSWAISGETLVITDSACGEGVVGAYYVDFPDDDEVVFTTESDACGSRAYVISGRWSVIVTHAKTEHHHTAGNAWGV